MNGYVQQLKTSIDRQTLLLTIIGVLAAFGVGLVVARWELKGMAILLLVPIVLAVVIMCLYRPKIGFLIYVQVAFIVNGLNRFTPFQAPFGTMADGLLFLTLIGTLVNYKKMNWKNLHNPVFYLVLLWTSYTVLQLFNPETPNPGTWVYAARIESLYWMQLTVLSLLLLKTKKDINQIVNLWLIWSVLAAAWAFKQRYIGLTSGEQRWLDAGGALTHVLFGRLRCFSFYSDAGQFGVEMAYATLLCFIRVLEEKELKQKLLFLLVGGIVFWGYAVSGTRGALFVMLAGLPVYIILRRNFYILIVGALIGGSLFGFLKYTTAANGVYEIQRMRSALDPENDSFQVRLNNQKKLSVYMASRPFGAGIGNSGEYAKRFNPNSFLARTPPDSWYVMIWIETGVVGISMYLCFLIFFATYGMYKVTRPALRATAPDLQLLMLSLLCGYCGVVVASYGNPVFGQFPTNSIMSISIALLCSDHITRIYTEPKAVVSNGALQT